MIIVTGGAGFIGSNLVRALNRSGRSDIMVVDDLRDAHKVLNLSDCRIEEYVDMHEFLARITAGQSLAPRVEAIFHQGACTDTTEWNGLLMMRQNHEYSKGVFAYATHPERRIPLVYASSASVYGAGREFRVSEDCERPINVYAFSKLMFDRFVRRSMAGVRSPVVGLRYFNVYGPGEAHKGRMASVIHHFNEQLKGGDEIALFAGSDGYPDGEQRRDFIHVDDVVAVNLWAMSAKSGIYNLGTGRARSFNDVARAVLAFHGRGRIRYVPFPDHLRGSYQSFTEADLTGLRAAGYGGGFLDIEAGVERYLAAVSPAAAGAG